MDTEYLYRLAALEFPESAKKWMPNWFTEHPAFKEIKNSNVFKIFSKFGLSDFRQPLQDNSNLEDFIDLLTTEVSKVVKELVKIPNSAEADQLEQVAYKLLQQIMMPNIWQSDKHKLIAQIQSEDKRFRIDAGTSIIKAYNIIKIKAAKLNIQARDLETAQEFKNYSKRGNLTIVFSTKPSDIAAISSRSDWESCQTLETNLPVGLNACLIGSTLSKFIGVIYITSGADFRERGEKMVVRSLVRFVVDTNTNKPAIVVDAMYPSYHPIFAKNMAAALQSRSSVPVHDISTLSEFKDRGQFRVPKEKFKGVREHEKSYLDKPEFFSTLSPEHNEHLPVNNYIKFFEEYLKGLTTFLTIKIARFIIFNGKAKFPELKDLKGEVESNSYKLARKISRAVARNIVIKISQHYANGKNPFASGLLTKIVNNDIKKPYQKGLIYQAISDYGSSDLEKSNNKGKISLLETIINTLDLKEDLTDYIFDQLITLSE